MKIENPRSHKERWAAIDSQTDEIARKYSRDIIKDDGYEDALIYADLKMEVWRIQNPDVAAQEFEPEWAEAVKTAKASGGRDVKALRRLIFIEGADFQDEAEDGEGRAGQLQLGKALKNLSLSF